MHILVQNKSVTNRRIFANLLKESDISCRAVETSFEALSALRETSYEVLILEKEVGLRDERESETTIQQLQSAGTDRMAILLTGYQFSKAEIVAAIDRGIEEVLVMPFTTEILFQKIAEIASQEQVPDQTD